MKFPSIHPLLQRLYPLMTHRRVAFAAVALGVGFTAPSLWNGFQSDDNSHRYVLLGKSGPFPPPAASRLDLFNFVPQEPARTMGFVDWGIFPWWTHPELRLSLFRPLTSLTHILDYALWPNSAFLMHVHNLVWYGMLVWIAAVLYRRWMGSGAAAGFAILFYALDDAHGFGAGWLANRNAVVCAFFGFASLVLHDRWRVERRRLPGVAAVAAYAAALLAGEGGVAASAYLLAYALFMENLRRGESRSMLRRLATLGAYGAVGLGYVLWYKLGGYGTRNSGVYIDPATNPWRFITEALPHAPILLLGQFAFPPSEIGAVLASNLRLAYSGFALLVVALGAVMAWPQLAGNKSGTSQAALAKTFLAGMLLSVVPICATFPSNRLLFFTGLGAMGLVGIFLSTVTQASGRCVRALAWLLLLVHGLLGPLGLPVNAVALRAPLEFLRPGIESFPFDEPNLPGKHVVAIINPVPFYPIMIAPEAVLSGKPIPLSFRTLASGTSDVEVRREDDRTLRIRPANGFNPGIRRPLREGRWAVVDFRRILVMLDSLFRDPEIPFRVGETVELSGMSVEVTEVNERGLAAEALFRFQVPLEDESLVWIEWEHWIFKRIAPPAVGSTVVFKGR